MPKAYWSILNTFLNNKKIPNIPPLNANGKIIFNLDKKMELFNSHFASQCTPINNSSVLEQGDIYLILKNLDPEKADGWDSISVRITQLCGKAIVEHLRILFLSFLEEGIYPDDWKKNNVVPIHKKESKNLIKNYRPISILSVFSKVFERIIFNSFFNYFLENRLFTECQSGFLPGDSCISQHLSITHKIYKSFDHNPSVDVTGTFLDISKAFDKV